MSEDIVEVMRANLPAATAYSVLPKAGAIRAKTNARIVILNLLPTLLEEVEQLRTANRLVAAACDAWKERAELAEFQLKELKYEEPENG